MNLKYLQIAVLVGFVFVLCSLCARFTWTDTWRNSLIEMSSVPPQREADLPVALEEMTTLIQTLVSQNADSFIGTRIYEPVHAGNYCIRGTIGLVFQGTRPLEEVVSNYANFFETEFRKNVTNFELVIYEITINRKSELLFDSDLVDDFDPFLYSTPPPEICRTSDLCYEVQVNYADPSNRECRGA